MTHICIHAYNVPYIHTYHIYISCFKFIPFLCIWAYKLYVIAYYSLYNFLNKFSTIYIFLPKFKKK